jgi:hypothetical protein
MVAHLYPTSPQLPPRKCGVGHFIDWPAIEMISNETEPPKSFLFVDFPLVIKTFNLTEYIHRFDRQIKYLVHEYASVNMNVDPIHESRLFFT